MYNGAVVDSITWRSAAGGRVGEGVPGARLQDRKSKLINYSIKIRPISDRHPPEFFQKGPNSGMNMHTGSWSTYLLANDLINSTVLLTPDKYSKFIGQWFFTAAADNALLPHKTTRSLSRQHDSTHSSSYTTCWSNISTISRYVLWPPFTAAATCPLNHEREGRYISLVATKFYVCKQQTAEPNLVYSFNYPSFTLTHTHMPDSLIHTIVSKTTGAKTSFDPIHQTRRNSLSVQFSVWIIYTRQHHEISWSHTLHTAIEIWILSATATHHSQWLTHRFRQKPCHTISTRQYRLHVL